MRRITRKSIGRPGVISRYSLVSPTAPIDIIVVAIQALERYVPVRAKCRGSISM